MSLTVTATNFIYDNVSISDFGLRICQVGNGGGVDTVDVSADISFKTDVTASDIAICVSSGYDKMLSISSFDLCPIDSNGTFRELSQTKIRAVSRLLHQSKTGFKKIKFCTTELADVSFYGKILGLKKIYVAGKVVGFRVTGIETNSPYAWSDDVKVELNMDSSEMNYNFVDYGDEVEKITIPNLRIEILEDCDFEIYNELTDSTFKIDDCVANEVIEINGFKTQLTSSVRTAQQLFEAFNNVFFNFSNTYRDSVNKLTLKGRANVTIETRFPRKVGE